MLCLIIVACNRFDRDHLLKSSFGADLQSLTSDRKAQYTDGLFLVYDVEDTDSLYTRFFDEPFHEGAIALSFGDRQFSSSEVGRIRYRLLDSLDGHTKTIFYIPDMRLLGFGFSDGLM